MKKPQVSTEQRAGQRLSEEQIARSVAMQQEFMELLRSQLASREGQFGPLQEYLRGLLPRLFETAQAPLEIGEPQGFSPETMAALRGSAIEAVPKRFDELNQRLRAQLAARGLAGGEGTSGLVAGPLAQIGIAEEQERAGALRDITVQNEMARRADLENRRQLALSRRQLELQGLGGAFGAGSDLLSRILASTDLSPFVTGALGGLGEAGGAVRTRTQETLMRPYQTPSFWGTLGRAALGAGIQAGANFLLPGAGWLAKFGMRTPLRLPLAARTFPSYLYPSVGT